MSNNVDRAEVFAGIQRRRRFTPEQKMAFVQKAAQPGMTISYVSLKQPLRRPDRSNIFL
jgi:transposase-like protein